MSTLWVANDHAAFEVKAHLLSIASDMGWTIQDLGAAAGQSVDYPDMADALAIAYDGAGSDRGLLICGSGIGIAMAANRHTHIRAAVCHDVTSARLSRAHNDANVLSLGARFLGLQTAEDCLRTFLTTDFEGGRHARRVGKLTTGFTTA